MEKGTKIISRSAKTEYTLTDIRTEKKDRFFHFQPSYKNVPGFTLNQKAFDEMKRRHVFDVID